MRNGKGGWLFPALLVVLLSPGLAAPPQAFLPTRASDPALWGTFITCVEYMERWVGPNIPDWVVHSSVISYEARKPLYDDLGRPLLDDRGAQRTRLSHQSGRVFFPPAWRMRRPAPMPIVMYSHATTLMKDAVASNFGGHEWAFAAAAAAYFGFAVAMPDQPGMGGDGAAFHPYCHARTLGYAIVDAIPAARASFTEDPFPAAQGYRWDGKVFLLGYSEGGYASLAAAREMETHPEDYQANGTFELAGSACMAGPFDISGTTRRVILDPNQPFGHPFFIPYVILGYNAVYGPVMDPLAALAPELLASAGDGNIMSWLNGAMDGLMVDHHIMGRLGVAAGAGVVARRLLNPDWVARELDDPAFEAGPLHRLLTENDVAEGWTPTRPILFCQSPDDRDVALENSRRAMASLGAAVRSAGGDPDRLLAFQSLGWPGSGPGHAAGVLLAIPVGFDWIYGQLPAERRLSQEP